MQSVSRVCREGDKGGHGHRLWAEGSLHWLGWPRVPHGEQRLEMPPGPFPPKLSHGPGRKEVEKEGLRLQRSSQTQDQGLLFWDENGRRHFDGSVRSGGGCAVLPSRPSLRIKITLWLLPGKREFIGIVNGELGWEAGTGREGVSGCRNGGI